MNFLGDPAFQDAFADVEEDSDFDEGYENVDGEADERRLTARQQARRMRSVGGSGGGGGGKINGGRGASDDSNSNVIITQLSGSPGMRTLMGGSGGVRSRYGGNPENKSSGVGSSAAVDKMDGAAAQM